MSDYNPAGEIRLISESYETPSTHLEYEHHLKISPEGSSHVALIEEESKKNFIKTSDSFESSSKYIIEIDKLVSFIRTNGQRV